MINRTLAPYTSQVTQIEIANPVVLKTKSGIPFYFIEEIPEDVAKITLNFAAGKMHQTQILEASFTTDLLLSGTASKSQQEIQEAIDFYGGYVQCELGMENSTVTIYGLNKNISAIYEIIFDAMSNPIYPEKEFEQHRTIERQKYLVSMEKNASRARKHFINSLLGGTPFDSSATIEDFDKVTQEQCVTFHQKHFLNGLIDVNVVGNLPVELKSKMLTDFENWKNVHDTSLACELNPKTDLFEEKKAEALQTAIRIGKILFTPQHDEYIEFDVVNTILGGYFGSRLMSNIREDKGYTYGIGSGVVSMKSLGYFYISTEVGVDVKENTLKEVQFEIEKLQNELVDESELDLVRNYMIGQLLKSTDGPFAMMNQFLFLNNYDLPNDYFDRYIQSIQAITPERIRELAKKHLNWNTFSIITVG